MPRTDLSLIKNTTDEVATMCLFQVTDVNMSLSIKTNPSDIKFQFSLKTMSLTDPSVAGLVRQKNPDMSDTVKIQDHILETKQ